MNGQYLMNKEISVQYAYKKDGKGERHGDQAERMLAAQARKHNVQPTAQPLPQQLFAPPTPSGPTVLNGDAHSVPGTPVPPSGFGLPPHPPPAAFQSVPPPPHQQQQQQQQRPPSTTPLPPPPSGLPARPPPSQAGYGGPAGFLPPGFTAPAPPPGFAPPPPGFGPPPGQAPPPGLPPGFQQPPPGFSRR
jgi:splicing factor 3B subunit 4